MLIQCPLIMQAFIITGNCCPFVTRAENWRIFALNDLISNRKMKKQLKAKEPIRLRSKMISNGNQSLYLDFYVGGRRKYEFLRLYIVPEYSKEDKEKNEQCLRLANAIKARRIIELQNDTYGFRVPSIKARDNFLDYIDLFVQNKKMAYRRLAQSLKNHIIKYRGNKILFCQIDKHFITGFAEYLNTTEAMGNVSKQRKRPLSQATRWNYFNILSLLLNKAQREGFIVINPMKEVDSEKRPQRAEPRRTFLTIEEVRKLAETSIKRKDVKRAFLFSCLCGLRFSDIKRLGWDNMQKDSKGNVIAEIVQQKTGSLLYLPISREALKQLPTDMGQHSGLVFATLPDASYTTKILKKWAKMAGIHKNVTFHVARHTFATLGLTYGAELYTISKLLGHSNIKMTQIYADIINEKKLEAVNAIPSIAD